MRNRFLMALALAAASLASVSHSHKPLPGRSIRITRASTLRSVTLASPTSTAPLVGSREPLSTTRRTLPSPVSRTLRTPLSVATNVEARDKHLKSPDFFDVEKFPTLSFKSTSISNAGGKLTLTGDLTLHGVTKESTAYPVRRDGLPVSGFTDPAGAEPGRLRSL